MKKLRILTSIIVFSLFLINSKAFGSYSSLYSLNKSFMNGEKAFIHIGYSSSEDKPFDDCKNIEIGKLTYKNYLRHGYSFLFGWERFESDGIRKLDFTYNFLIQFPYIGADHKIIGVDDSFTLVPYFGIAPGIGLRTDSFPDIYKFSDSGDWLKDTFNNYIVMRLKGGVDLTVAPGLSFSFQISKNLTMDKGTTYWIGINVDY